MVDGWVVERPRDGHRFFKTQNFSLVVKTWLKWGPDGATRGKERHLVGKVEEWVCGKPAPQRLYPPPVLIKDRSVGPHEQVLNVPIACQWYAPDKPSSLLLIDILAFSTASLVGSREKLCTDLWIDQAAYCRLCWEPFFSGAVTLSNSVDDSWKVATYGDRPQEAYVSCWSGFPL
jgi:hypothetical protein